MAVQSTPPATQNDHDQLAWERMARILLVRHAPTPETGTRLTGRIPGVSLGEAGEEAALATSRALAGLDLEAVYSSPIERTLETARIVAGPHGLVPILEPSLTEIDFGCWTGQDLDDLRRDEQWGTVQMNPARFRFPGGESFVEAQTRAVASVERIAEDLGDGTAVAVSHSDVIKLVLAYFLGQPLDLFQRLRIAPTSISDLRLDRNRPPWFGSINSPVPNR